MAENPLKYLCLIIIEEVNMTYTRVMGIYVTDEQAYSKYREGMLPILESFGGSFGYDFKVSEVLKVKEEGPINRVFTIEFPSEQSMGQFFSDPNYLSIKKAHFDGAVSSRTTLALFEGP